ncbi:MAG TPA: BON domain-containing protein [Terriglobia bacterium]|nr:BON domain-containing protein [Terriglobia bacterium]
MRRTLVSISLILLLAGGIGYAREPMSKAEITAAIQDHLYHAHVFQHGQVQVAFENSVATLTGTVDNLGAKLDAERAAHKVDDVMNVVDDITVRAEDVTPSQILEEARKAIVTYPFYTIFDNIVLEAQGNKLIVSGQVSEPYKKGDIGRFLTYVKGVAELQNNLEVLPTSNYDDELRIAIARAIYNDPYFVHYRDQALPPIHIIVKNGNVTLDGVVANQLDRVKAENDARFAATFFSLTDNLRVEQQQSR